MTFGEAANIVAKKNELGTTLVTGHKASYFQEAAELYCLEEKKRVWKEACESQLALIAKTFRENKHKGSFNDQPVFQAIAETIKNHPLAEFKP
jgi:hypothetical protein